MVPFISEITKDKDVLPIVVSHQKNNDLDFLYMEIFYYKIPLVHNSKSIKDLGYFYEEENIYDGSFAMKSALDDRKKESFISKIESDKTKLSRYSPFNEETQQKYSKAIRKVIAREFRFEYVIPQNSIICKPTALLNPPVSKNDSCILVHFTEVETINQLLLFLDQLSKDEETPPVHIFTFNEEIAMYVKNYSSFVRPGTQVHWKPSFNNTYNCILSGLCPPNIAYMSYMLIPGKDIAKIFASDLYLKQSYVAWKEGESHDNSLLCIFNDGNAIPKIALEMFFINRELYELQLEQICKWTNLSLNFTTPFCGAPHEALFMFMGREMVYNDYPFPCAMKRIKHKKNEAMIEPNGRRLSASEVLNHVNRSLTIPSFLSMFRDLSRRFVIENCASDTKPYGETENIRYVFSEDSRVENPDIIYTSNHEHFVKGNSDIIHINKIDFKCAKDVWDQCYTNGYVCNLFCTEAICVRYSTIA
jgi:hypothetical protein